MPTYHFQDKDTGEVLEKFMKIADKDTFLKDNPNLTFIPEDVYSECVNERAFLFTSPTGFLVFTIEVDRYTKDKTLYMWLAYTYNIGGHQWIAHEQWIESVAKELDCKFIEAQSNVP